MTVKQQLVLDYLVNSGYPAKVVWQGTTVHTAGWYFMDVHGDTYYLGWSFDTLFYNIDNQNLRKHE